MRKLACHAYGLQHINKKKARGEMTSDKAERSLNPNPNRKSPMNLNSNPPGGILTESHGPTTLQFMIERTC